MEDTINKLEAMFNKAESDIDYVSRKLDAECANVTDESNQVNPAEVVKRLNEVKNEYGAIVKEAQAIQEAQKDAMLFFRDQVTNLCTTLSSLQNTTGLEQQLEKPAELEQFETLLGIEIPTSSNSGTAASSELGVTGVTDGGDDNTYTLKPPVQSSRKQAISTSASGNKCPGVVEPELSAYDRRVNCCECLEIDEKEFNSVSTLIRGRAKLAEVNHTYQILWSHFKENKNRGVITHSQREAYMDLVENSAGGRRQEIEEPEPLSSSEMHKMGLRVTGQTGEAKIKVLRALKLLTISKKGEVLFL